MLPGVARASALCERAHDALMPGVPLAGFHCNGEIGTFGDTTHLHGYTAAIALLRPRDGADAR